MMFAALPTIVIDVAAWVGVITAVLALITALTRFTVLKTVWRYLISEPHGRWIAYHVLQATEREREASESHRQFVRYHLGPNGDATPLHVRITMLENHGAFLSVRQQRLLNAVDIGIAESGADGENIFINTFLCELLECDPADWAGQGWKAFIVDEQKAAEIERWEFARDHGKENPRHICTFITKKTRTKISAWCESYPLYNVDGEVIGHLGEIRPIEGAVE